MNKEANRNQLLIIAHRGASVLAPENTMASFRLAKELGADGIELDVMLSADDRLVVIHDLNVSRTTDGQGKVNEMKWDQLKNLDAGSSFDDEKFAGEPLPLLEQVFEELGGQLLINVELKNNATPKDQLTEKVIRLIQDMALADAVLLSSFNGRNLLVADALAANIRKGLLTLPGLGRSLFLGLWMRRYPFDALHPNYKDVSQKAVDLLHKQGKQINVWTVDRANDLLKMKHLGVDMVICNDPAHARGVIETE